MVFRRGRSEGLMLPDPYTEFIKLVKHLKDAASPNHKIGILTFNYDVIVDVACHVGGIAIDYRLDHAREESRVPLLKLHGSLNWTRRKSDGTIWSWQIHPFLKALSADRGWELQSDNYAPVTLPIGSSLPATTKEGDELTGSAVLVAPTASKTESQRTLAPVWGAAAESLAEAENIFVIGYSMPTTDSFFRFLYALGTVGNVPLKRFWVFNPDSTGEVDRRFHDLLGPGAESRYRWFQEPFKAALPIIRSAFPEKRFALK